MRAVLSGLFATRLYLNNHYVAASVSLWPGFDAAEPGWDGSGWSRPPSIPEISTPGPGVENIAPLPPPANPALYAILTSDIPVGGVQIDARKYLEETPENVQASKRQQVLLESRLTSQVIPPIKEELKEVLDLEQCIRTSIKEGVPPPRNMIVEIEELKGYPPTIHEHVETFLHLLAADSRTCIREQGFAADVLTAFLDHVSARGAIRCRVLPRILLVEDQSEVVIRSEVDMVVEDAKERCSRLQTKQPGTMVDLSNIKEHDQRLAGAPLFFYKAAHAADQVDRFTSLIRQNALTNTFERLLKNSHANWTPPSEDIKITYPEATDDGVFIFAAFCKEVQASFAAFDNGYFRGLKNEQPQYWQPTVSFIAQESAQAANVLLTSPSVGDNLTQFVKELPLLSEVLMLRTRDRMPDRHRFLTHFDLQLFDFCVSTNHRPAYLKNYRPREIDLADLRLLIIAAQDDEHYMPEEMTDAELTDFINHYARFFFEASQVKAIQYYQYLDQRYSLEDVKRYGGSGSNAGSDDEDTPKKENANTADDSQGGAMLHHVKRKAFDDLFNVKCVEAFKQLMAACSGSEGTAEQLVKLKVALVGEAYRDAVQFAERFPSRPCLPAPAPHIDYLRVGLVDPDAYKNDFVIFLQTHLYANRPVVDQEFLIHFNTVDKDTRKLLIALIGAVEHQFKAENVELEKLFRLRTDLLQCFTRFVAKETARIVKSMRRYFTHNLPKKDEFEEYTKGLAKRICEAARFKLPNEFRYHDHRDIALYHAFNRALKKSDNGAVPSQQEMQEILSTFLERHRSGELGEKGEVFEDAEMAAIEVELLSPLLSSLMTTAAQHRSSIRHRLMETQYFTDFFPTKGCDGFYTVMRAAKQLMTRARVEKEAFLKALSDRLLLDVIHFSKQFVASKPMLPSPFIGYLPSFPELQSDLKTFSSMRACPDYTEPVLTSHLLQEQLHLSFRLNPLGPVLNAKEVAIHAPPRPGDPRKPAPRSAPPKHVSISPNSRPEPVPPESIPTVTLPYDPSHSYFNDLGLSLDVGSKAVQSREGARTVKSREGRLVDRDLLQYFSDRMERQDLCDIKSMKKLPIFLNTPDQHLGWYKRFIDELSAKGARQVQTYRGDEETLYKDYVALYAERGCRSLAAKLQAKSYKLDARAEAEVRDFIDTLIHLCLEGAANCVGSVPSEKKGDAQFIIDAFIRPDLTDLEKSVLSHLDQYSEEIEQSDVNAARSDSKRKDLSQLARQISGQRKISPRQIEAFSSAAIGLFSAIHASVPSSHKTSSRRLLAAGGVPDGANYSVTEEYVARRGAAVLTSILRDLQSSPEVPPHWMFGSPEEDAKALGVKLLTDAEGFESHLKERARVAVITGQAQKSEAEKLTRVPAWGLSDDIAGPELLKSHLETPLLLSSPPKLARSHVLRIVHVHIRPSNGIGEQELHVPHSLVELNLNAQELAIANKVNGFCVMVKREVIQALARHHDWSEAERRVFQDRVYTRTVVEANRLVRYFGGAGSRSSPSASNSQSQSSAEALVRDCIEFVKFWNANDNDGHEYYQLLTTSPLTLNPELSLVKFTSPAPQKVPSDDSVRHSGNDGEF